MIEETKKPVFKIKSRIITKSLLMVMCLLLPVILIFQYISHKSDETESRLETERKNLEFSTRINRAASTAALASGYLLIHLLMNNEKATDGWLVHRQAALDENRRLEILSNTINDPVKNKYVKPLVEQTYKTFDLWTQLRPAGSTMEIRDVVSNLKSMRKYFLYVFRLHRVFQKMELEEQSRLVEAIEQGKRDRAQFSLILNAALFILFALAIFIVVNFTREITDRLKIVVENASRLPRREKLNELIQGTDEISYLDSVLHQAADKLEQSAQFRNSLLEMVAHDMCSPLSAVTLSLAILQSEVGEKISQSSAEKFAKAGSRIEYLVLKAKCLLAIERLCANSPDLAYGDVEISKGNTDNQSDENINELSRLIRIEFRSAAGFGSEAAHRFRPGIFKKGLALVLLPLIFSTVMIVTVSHLNQKASHFLDVELKQSEIAVAINRLMMSTAAHMAVVGNYQMYGRDENRDLQGPVSQLGEKNAEKLIELTGDDPQTVSDVKELSELDRRETQRLAKEQPVVTDFRSLPTPAFAVPGRAILIYSIKKMEKIQKITDRQIEKMALTRRQEDEAKRQVDTCLEVGISGSLIIALILVCAFDYDISRRLKVLTANAEILPLRKPLRETVRGRDEIWYLDFVLHDVAEILDATWQQRKVMMELLAADLRKPLQDTREILELVPLEESSQFDDLRTRHFKFATANVDRVLSLVEALLTIENLEQGKIELVKSTFAAKDAAQEAIASVSALAQDRKVFLANDCAGIQLYADKGRVIQVLVNFLANAINHSPADTTVSVDTSLTQLGVRFDVIDEGPGLSPEMRKKVFERFFQTADSKTKGKGYGLGLAICKMIAEAHEGSVGCDEAATGGCSFYAVFPNAQP